MIQAIAKGVKTQTRRVIKHPKYGLDIPAHMGYMLTSEGNALYNGPDYPDDDSDEIKCPYGIPGDVLYVREGFHFYKPQSIYSYRADDKRIEDAKIWKPGIHMPFEAVRTWLEVASVKVERLQAITEKDAEKEGIATVYPRGLFGEGYTRPDRALSQPAKSCFEHLWEKINGNGSWKANPWVFVIEFKKIDEPKEWDIYVKSKRQICQ